MATEFIAEVSSNHNGDLARCIAFVDAAADLGCDGVKFQLFRVDALFAPSVLDRSAAHRSRARWELPPSFLPDIKARCEQRGIALGCTPFYLEAVEVLRPFVDFYKIASYELLWEPLFAACAATGKPLAFSTGIATLAEVDRVAALLGAAGCRDVIVYHCVSAYPTRPADCNLAAIDTLRRRYGFRVGWSDHSVRPEVVHRAVGRWQADAVEFHLDLDGQGWEFGGGHCWLPEEIGPVIRGIRRGLGTLADPDIADGSGEKVFTPPESPERLWRRDPEDGLRPFKALR